MKSFILGFYLALLCVAIRVQGKKDEIYKEECAVWNNVTTIVESEPRLNVTCKTNHDCTGFDCNGQYSYQNTFLTGGDMIYRSTCFGVDLHPCSKVADMTVYIDIAHYKSSYLKNITADRDDTLPDVEEDPLPGTKVKVELNVEFETIEKNHKQYAKIHMILQPVVHGPLGITNRPREARVVMVPDVEVPIPRCDQKVQEIVHKKGVCPDLSGTGGQGFKKAERFFVPGTENCTRHSMKPSCGEKQTCETLKNDTTKTACHCLRCHYYSERLKRCEEDRALCDENGNGPLIVIDDGVVYEPSTGGNPHKNKVNVVAIACGVASVFVVAILVLLVLFVYRRYRHRFGHGSGGDRAAVLGNEQMEDDNDDDPISL